MKAHPNVPSETFAPLNSLTPKLFHSFLGRIPDLDVRTERAQAMELIQAPHAQWMRENGLGEYQFAQAEQVHGAEIALIDGKPPLHPISGVDGLITNQPGVCLGIYVADCCAIFLVDSRTQGLAVLHSGKKGTELGILPRAIALMTEHFGSDPQEMHVVLSPCIRPPHYEVDFAAEIRRQAANSGLPSTNIHDEGICTATHIDRYYSYRREQGKTGRMLALAAWRP